MYKLFLLLLLTLACASARAAPEVVVTLNPLHSLAAALMEGAGAPELLLNGTASPHDFALRPSDMRKLVRADLILRVGNSLEPQIGRVIANAGHEARLLDAERIEGLMLRPLRDTHAARHTHGEAGIDPHLWLDPDNAVKIAEALAQRLVALDPQHAARYEVNLAALRVKLKTLDSAIAAALASASHRSYVAFHDGYQYFEARYGLKLVAVVAPDPALPLGLKRLVALRKDIAHTQTHCLVVEPQHASRLVEVVAEETGLKPIMLDPLGAGITPGPQAYAQLLQRTAERIVGCLNGP